ncbi:TRAP transporter substrate-binding protein [Rhodopila globiformis]|uniref:ABC transporter substrate-binding protein n=1 Tax=Rhodopila globiformis TaxID=1071 RepID=A0A2S6NIR8_RHOGL|nr:TRAP transporter substrate-binding protein [Rhodopila globiformis]PPQ34569.1 ABC transporter substrate-binding protein [Rhodopila globiformis]
MPTLARRSLLAGAALPLFAIRTRPARAADFTLKLANNIPATHPMTIRQQEAANRIKAATNGAVEIQVFPNNQLGGDTDTLAQLREGAVDLFTLSGLILATLVPPASINGVGFAFKDYDTVWKAMDGKLGAYVRGQISKRGLIAMDKMWDNGFRQITSSTHPIRTPADLKGFKIRVPVSPLWTSMFTALGASPISINFAEVYSALQTKIAEGQENPLTLIEIARLYEVQKYVSLTSHMWDGFWMLANRRSFSRLPADAQAILTREMNKSALDERADIAKLNGTVTNDLKSKGLEFVEADKPAFRQALKSAGFYAEWKKKYGDQAWGILESEVGPLS